MRKIAVLILVGCLAALVLMGLAPKVELESLASARPEQWKRFFKTNPGPAKLELGRDLLPTILPGPAEPAYGSRPHALRIVLPKLQGDYGLEIIFNDAAATSPPRLEIILDGKAVGRLQVPAGSGAPPPYLNPRPELTLRLPLPGVRPGSVLLIRSVEGSFCAPAKIRLTSGLTFNPAKTAYLLVTQKKRYLLPLLAALLLALFLLAWAKSGPRSALWSVLTLVVSCAVAMVAAELLFREYLIRFPQARRLAVQRNLAGADQAGAAYTFRTMIQPTADPAVPYRLKPNLDGRFAGKAFTTNSHHMRSPEVALAKPAGTIRLAGLGDSVGFGWGVGQDETYLAVLARLLAAGGRRVQQLNFACPSYNTAVETAVYQRMARPFKPDLAVMLFVANDFDMPSMMLEPVRRWRWDHSYIIEQLRRRLAMAWSDAVNESEPVFTSQDRPAPGGGDRQRQWLARLKQYYGRGAGLAGVKASLDDWSRLLAADGIPGILLYYPNRPDKPDPRVSQVLAHCRRLGIHTVDMTGPLAEYLRAHGGATMAQAIWIHPGDPHPNATGHRLMAEALARLIAQKRLLGPAP